MEIHINFPNPKSPHYPYTITPYTNSKPVMSSSKPSESLKSLYPEANSPNFSKTNYSSSSSLYPSIDMKKLAENLYPEDDAFSQQNLVP